MLTFLTFYQLMLTKVLSHDTLTAERGTAYTIQYNTIVFRAPNSLTQQRDGDSDYYSVAR